MSNNGTPPPNVDDAADIIIRGMTRHGVAAVDIPAPFAATASTRPTLESIRAAGGRISVEANGWRTPDPLATQITLYGAAPSETTSPRVFPFNPFDPPGPPTPAIAFPPNVATKADLAQMEQRIAAMVRDEIAAIRPASPPVERVLLGWKLRLIECRGLARAWALGESTDEYTTSSACAHLFRTRRSLEHTRALWSSVLGGANVRVVAVYRKTADR